MSQTGRNAPQQVQENRSGMFVGRNRLTKSYIPEMLQSVG
jgi:hypothetical protein